MILITFLTSGAWPKDRMIRFRWQSRSQSVSGNYIRYTHIAVILSPLFSPGGSTTVGGGMRFLVASSFLSVIVIVWYFNVFIAFTLIIYMS